MLLKKMGYTVFNAGEGKEALTIYQENKHAIDVVILDMIMTDMNGGEVFDRLKEIDPKVKVILTTGYSAGGQASEIIERGCKAFIQKPFDINQLSKKIADVLATD